MSWPFPRRLLRSDAAVCALLVLLVALFYADVLWGGRGLYVRDLASFHYPAKKVLRDVVLGGEFPHWNRAFAGGQPFAANPQHEVFYPLTWLILLPDFAFGFHLEIAVHVALALAGMYALLRSMRLGRGAAAFGALSWGFGGVTMSYTCLLPFLFSVAWLPLICLFGRKWLLERRARDFALCAAAFGMQVLICEPTSILQTGLLLGAWAIYRARGADRPAAALRFNLLSVGALSATALLVGFAQLLPTIDFSRDCDRSRPFAFSSVGTWSLPWPRLPEFFFPSLLGNVAIPSFRQTWSEGVYPDQGLPFLFSIYAGVLVGVLAIAAIFCRLRGSGLAALIAAASVLLAVGRHTPLLRASYGLGLLRSIRYPEKFVLMGSFALAVLAAVALNTMIEGDAPLRRAALRVSAALTAVASLALFATFTPAFPALMSGLWHLPAAAFGSIAVSLSRSIWVLTVARCTAAMLLVWTATSPRRTPWTLALLVFTVADLASVARSITPTMPRSFLSPSPAAAALPPDRNEYRLFHRAEWLPGTNPQMARYLATPEGSQWFYRNGIYPLFPAAAGIQTVLQRDIDRTLLLPTVDLHRALTEVGKAGKPGWELTLMAMSNAWYRAELRDFDEEMRRVGGDPARAIPVRLVEAAHQPRYYFAGQIVPITNPAEFASKLIANRYSPSVAFVRTATATPASGSVRVLRESANEAEMEVESTSDRALLVMSVTPHKYWRIAVDGRDVHAQATNLGYQSIEVPRGRHRVTMRYRNPLVAPGAAVSTAALLVLFAISARGRRRGSMAVEEIRRRDAA